MGKQQVLNKYLLCDEYISVLPSLVACHSENHVERQQEKPIGSQLLPTRGFEQSPSVGVWWDWGVEGGGRNGCRVLQAGEDPARICLKSLHFPWTDQVGCDGGGGGGSLPPRTMEKKAQACMSWTKLTPCETQRWLRACLGTIRLVWTPKLEGNWRAEQFPIHGENEEAEDLFNESAVGKGIYLQYYYLVAKNLLWPNVKSIFFFDKLKRLRKISRFWQRMVCKREVLSVRIWHQLHFVMVKNISIIY